MILLGYATELYPISPPCRERPTPIPGTFTCSGPSPLRSDGPRSQVVQAQGQGIPIFRLPVMDLSDPKLGDHRGSTDPSGLSSLTPQLTPPMHLGLCRSEGMHGVSLLASWSGFQIVNSRPTRQPINPKEKVGCEKTENRRLISTRICIAQQVEDILFICSGQSLSKSHCKRLKCEEFTKGSETQKIQHDQNPPGWAQRLSFFCGRTALLLYFN